MFARTRDKGYGLMQPTCSWRDYVGFCLGVTAILCWMFAQVPQIISNFRNKSAESLSPWFLFSWLAGDSFNLAGALIQGEQLPTTTYTAMYFMMSDAVMISQYVYYGAHNHKHTARMPGRLQLAALWSPPHSLRGSRSLDAEAGHHMGPQQSSGSPEQQMLPVSTGRTRSARSRRCGSGSSTDSSGSGISSVIGGGGSFGERSGCELSGRICNPHTRSCVQRACSNLTAAARKQPTVLVVLAATAVLALGALMLPPGLSAASDAVGQGAVNQHALLRDQAQQQQGHQQQQWTLGEQQQQEQQRWREEGQEKQQQGQQHKQHQKDGEQQQQEQQQQPMIIGGRPGSSANEGSSSGASGGSGASGDNGAGSGGHGGGGMGENANSASIGTVMQKRADDSSGELGTGSGRRSASKPAWRVTLGTVIGWVSSCFYITSRVSQIIKNNTRGSSEGLALAMFVMAIVANACTGAGILLRTSTFQQLVHQGPWLVGSLGVIALDVVILGQSLNYGAASNQQRLGHTGLKHSSWQG